MWFFCKKIERGAKVTKAELGIFTEQLKAKEVELILDIKQREGIVIVGNVGDLLDDLSESSERLVAIHGVDRGSKLLKDVRGALRRIERGEFGICLRCEEEISALRLAAVPWAAFCAICQEVVDSGQIDELAEGEDQKVIDTGPKQKPDNQFFKLPSQAQVQNGTKHEPVPHKPIPEFVAPDDERDYRDGRVKRVRLWRKAEQPQ